MRLTISPSASATVAPRKSTSKPSRGSARLNSSSSSSKNSSYASRSACNLVHMAINTVTIIKLKLSGDSGIVGIQRMPPNAQEMALYDRSLPK